jgi:NitT/TauT family transport system substrate-binding protein
MTADTAGASDRDVHRLSRRQLLQGAAGLGLAAVAGGILLPACGSDGDGEARTGEEVAADGPLETTSIRLWSVPPFNCIAGMYMAERFLREEGFTDVQYPQVSPKELTNSFVVGAIDFGVHYAAVVTPPIADGAPLAMLGGIHVGCWQVIASGDIKTMRDLKGKTVSIVGPNFTDGIFMAMTLANVGLDLNKDVKLVSYPPSEHARLLSSGEVDAVVVTPPITTDLRAKGIGRVVLNSVIDPPWSNYYCCVAVANRNWMEKHPVATKRALRALLKGADVVAKDPDGSARFMVDRGYTSNYDYTCEILKEIPYDVWRDFDPVDSVRFYALRLKEAGIIKSTPDEIIKRGTDFRHMAALKRELKEA